VIDGPFPATNELVAGFWLWEVKDMAEAVEWVGRCPNPMPGPSEIEIRPVFEIQDFGEAMTPGLIEHDSRSNRKGRAAAGEHRRLTDRITGTIRAQNPRTGIA
jgi:hypothetical protein